MVVQSHSQSLLLPHSKSNINGSFIRKTIRKARAMTGIEVERIRINLNTIIAAVGFLSTFAILVTMWNDQLNSQKNTDRWIEQHTLLHEAIAKDLTQLHGVDTARDSQVLDITFRLAQLEKGQDNLDARVGRVTESSTNQFTDIRSALSAFGTQQALMTQTLQRIEAAGKLGMVEPPKEFKK